MRLLTLICKLIGMLVLHGNIPVHISMDSGDCAPIERACFDGEDDYPVVFLCDYKYTDATRCISEDD